MVLQWCTQWHNEDQMRRNELWDKRCMNAWDCMGKHGHMRNHCYIRNLLLHCNFWVAPHIIVHTTFSVLCVSELRTEMGYGEQGVP